MTVFTLCLGLAAQLHNTTAQSVNSEADNYLSKARRLYEESRYDSVPWYFERARDLYRKSGDVSMEVQSMLGLADGYRMLHDYGKSGASIRRAEVLLRKMERPDSVLFGELWYIKGKIWYNEGKYDAAVTGLHRSLSCFERWAPESDRPEKVLDYLTTIHIRRRDLDSAEYFLSRLITHIGEYDHSPSIMEARYFARMSTIMWARGNYQAELEYTSKRIRIEKQVFGQDFPGLERSYRQMADNYSLVEEFDSATIYLDSAQTYIRKYFPDDKEKQAWLFISKGTAEYRRGNYSNALDAYERGRKILEDGAGTSAQLAYTLDIAMGNVYYVKKDFRTALGYYLRLLDFIKTANTSQMLDACHYLAITYKNMEEYRLAEYYYRKLIGVRARYFESDSTALATDYIDYGIFLDETGRTGQSLLYLREALEIRKKLFGNDHYQTADCYMRVGDHYAKAAEPDSSLLYYQQALHSLDRSYDPVNPLENPDHTKASHQRVFIQAMKGKAAMLEELAGKKSDSLRWLKAALDCYNRIIPAIDRLRNESMSEEGRLFISDNERDAYENAVRLSLDLYQRTGNREDLEAAFRMAEKAKYSTLLMAVRNNNAISFSGVPQEIQARLRSLRSRISAYMDLISEAEGAEGPDSTRLAGLYASFYELKDQEAALISKLEQEYPEYYRLKYNTRVAEIDGIRKRLGRKDRMIEYFLGDSSLVTFVLTRNDLFSVSRPVDSTFQLNIDLVKGFCSASFVSGNKAVTDDAFRQAASDLYDLLIGPCRVRKGERLILIPDEGMNYLSFDVLLSEKVTDRRDYVDFPFLIRDHPIIYSYSSTLFLDPRPGQSGRNTRLLAMAPAYYGEKKGISETIRAQEVRRDELEPLLGGRDEIQGIQRIIGGDAVYGSSASEYRFKEEAPEYGILHLAMHAFMDDTDPLYSRLIFSDDTSGDEDGFLNAHEIYNMDLHAGMVVLSACHTGEGIVRKGEGIMSLARAFYYSGVPDVVMSLWTVSDTSGRNLMIDFYKELSKGLPKGMAMQRAKLSMLNVREPDRQEPYYWSAYIVTGDPDPLFHPMRKRLLLVALVLIAAAAITFLVLRRMRKKKGDTVRL